MSPAGLLTLALLAPAAPPAAAPRLQRGDELTYTGAVTEAVDRPGNRFRRTHALEARVFVLDRQATWADAAVLTLLRRADDAAVAGAVPALTGATPAAVPPAARLDFVRIHEDGTAHRLTPPGPAPLRFDAQTPAWVLPAVPLETFAPFEFGMFPPRQPGKDAAWAVASAAPDRPAERWAAAGPEFVQTEQCAKLAMVQQTADWETPRGGYTAWRRADAVWASTQDGMARRVHRVTQVRDGITPAVRVEVRYELTERARLIDRTYDRYRREVETAYAYAADLAPLARDAAKLGPEPFKARLARLDAYLDESAPGTPYREAVLAVRRGLDAAARGEVAPVAAVATTSAVTVAKGTGHTPAVGQPAPDFRAGPFHLADARGKPVVLVFFMPGRKSADLSLAIADGLRAAYGDRLAVAALAVFADAATGVKDRDRLKLTVPVHDGSAAAAAYGVDTFPRFVVIDAAGRVKWAFAGVGAETGYLAREQADALLTPAAGATGARGTTSQAGGSARPPATRP